MSEVRAKDSKREGRTHTGMIEFRYSKLIEDYLRAKAGTWDEETQRKLNPKREAICVVLHNVDDDVSGVQKNLKIQSFILRSGNFGTPQLPNNYFRSPSRQESMLGSLPTISESQPTLVTRSFTEIALRDAALGIAQTQIPPRTAASSRASTDRVALPSIRSRPHTMALSKRRLLGNTSLKADRSAKSKAHYSSQLVLEEL